MIELVSAAYRVGEKEIVRGVDLRVKAGEIVSVIGPNGAGKSTLHAMASGDFAPTTGSVRFAGRELATYSDLELARERAVLRQSSTLEFAFRVIDVALMGRNPRSLGRYTATDLAIAEEALAQVGLDGMQGRVFPTLSGGEKQRVHLARALTQIALGAEGKALLLDEPTAALDPAHQHRVLSIARDVAKSGLAVLTVLHDANLAAQYADRIVVLSHGAIAAEGSPSAVLTEELFRDVFSVEAHVSRAPWDDRLPWVAIVGGARARKGVGV